MAADKSTVICTVLAMDTTNFCYRACKLCERALPDHPPNSSCIACKSKFPASFPSHQHLFRLLLSIATDTKVMVVICFDRAAKVLFGCSAHEFLDFAKIHPFAAENASKVLEGEMLQMTLSKPKNLNAQHLRAVTIVPLRSGFQPVIQTLRELYGVQGGP
ncbi:hypothetical protein SLA2020_374830 [Shorea laevis]